jgi:uncharacterized protein
MKNLSTFILAFFLSLNSILGQEIDILPGVLVTLRDGTKLSATVYKPTQMNAPLPAIINITPYITDSNHPRGVYFAKNGYVFAIVDSRGRGNSEGVFDPFEQEAKDGYDVVEWFSKQKYSNGAISMWGGSYCGYNQWATAKEFPPHLKSIVPVASVKPGIDFPMRNNIYSPYAIQWLTFTDHKKGNLNLFSDSSYWSTKFEKYEKKGIAFKALDSLVGNPNKTFQKWISHGLYDEYYKNMSPTQTQYSQLNIPILSITGQYDGDQLGALTFYKDYTKNAKESARKKHYLIIGPWDHPGTRTPKKEIGGLIFGDSSVLDMNKLHKEWYNFVLKDGSKPSFLKNNVAYFISNRNTWKYTNTLEEIGKEKLNFI